MTPTLLDKMTNEVQQKPENICRCENVEMGSYDNQVQVFEPFTNKMVGVDLCVLPDVAALWSAGIPTIESCCGHGKATGYIAVHPQYVGAMDDLGYERYHNAPHCHSWPRKVTTKSQASEREKALQARVAELEWVANNTAEHPDSAAIRLLNELRSDTAASVTILCENEEANNKSEQMGIDVCAEWTDWKEKRFMGESILQAAASASIARAQALAGGRDDT